MSADDAAQTCFRDQRWLETFPLNRDSALDYFARSAFYDRTCNNQQLIMQGLAPTKERLAAMTGIEYLLQHSNETYGTFVITKNERRRERPEISMPVAAYYVVNGNVFQAPDMHSVLQNRLQQAVLSFNDALELAASHSHFDPSAASGYSWLCDGEDCEASSDSATADTDVVPDLTFYRKDDTRKVVRDRRIYDAVLRQVIKFFPPVTQREAGGVTGSSTSLASSARSSAGASRSSSQADLNALEQSAKRSRS